VVAEGGRLSSCNNSYYTADKKHEPVAYTTLQNGFDSTGSKEMTMRIASEALPIYNTKAPKRPKVFN
jgi:hypothetical protein